MQDPMNPPCSSTKNASLLIEERSDPHPTPLDCDVKSEIYNGRFIQALLQNPLEDIRERGYALVQDVLPSQVQLDALYAQFDQLLDSPNFEDWRRQVNLECQDWQRLPGNASAYANAPMGLRDRRTREDKADKQYFQYCPELFYYQKSFSGTYCRHPLAAAFYRNLKDISDIAVRVFETFVARLKQENPTAYKVIYQGRPKPVVLTKVLSYEPSDKWGTAPHWDKSVMTLVVNADDVQCKDPFRIGCNRKDLSIDDLSAPNRQVDNEHNPSIGLLFPGLCLRELGISGLMPSPHGVVPLNDRKARRHSIICFLLAPGIDTSAIKTDIFDDMVATHH